MRLMIFALIGLLMSQSGKTIEPFNGKTLIIRTVDGLDIKADFYENADTSCPIILLFHQAGYSRGEYRQIAPKLNHLGFACIAIDQRSGKEVNGIENETFIQANNKKYKTEHVEALTDLKATIDFAISHYKNRKIILWGSSYSASLVFILGKEYKNKVSGIIAFSPGEYFRYEGLKIEDYAKEIECPVFITSKKDEQEAWISIFQNVKSTEKYYFLPQFTGQHGSKALWDTNEGNEKYWTALTAFLDKIKRLK